VAYRGGNWDNGVQAGVFALNLNNTRSNVNPNIGFRAALPETSEKIAAHGQLSRAQAKEPRSLSRRLVRPAKKQKMPVPASRKRKPEPGPGWEDEDEDL